MVELPAELLSGHNLYKAGRCVGRMFVVTLLSFSLCVALANFILVHEVNSLKFPISLAPSLLHSCENVRMSAVKKTYHEAGRSVGRVFIITLFALCLRLT